MSSIKIIITGIIQGIANNAGAIASAVKSAASSAISWAAGHLGSTAEEYSAKTLGVPIMEGVSAGVMGEQQSLATTLAGTLRAAIEKVATTATQQTGVPTVTGQPATAAAGGIHIENVNVSAERPEMFLRELNIVAMRATL